MVILADVGIYRSSRAVGIIIVTNGGNKGGLPTVNEGGNIRFGLSRTAKITNDGEWLIANAIIGLGGDGNVHGVNMLGLLEPVEEEDENGR